MSFTELKLDNKVIQLPIIEGTEGEKAIAQNTYALMNASFDQSKWSDAKATVFNQSIVSSRELDTNELRNKVKNSMDSIALGENDSARGI